MPLTINPLNNQYKNNQNYSRPAFTGASQTIEQEIKREITKSSDLFKPINEAYDKFTTKIAENVTSRIVNFGPLNTLADKLKNSNNLFQYCLTLGSVITSGLYMQRTYTNKNLDKDRRNTLVVNQGLTLAVSTAGAYLLDGYMKNWWDNVTARFAGHLLNDNSFYKDFIKDKTEIMNQNKQIKADAKAKGIKKPELKSLPKVIDRIMEHSYYKSLEKSASEDAKTLMSKVKGMGPLRSMIVFGFVYRFFVPVAVTKPANVLCEKYLEKKKAKQAQAKQV